MDARIGQQGNSDECCSEGDGLSSLFRMIVGIWDKWVRHLGNKLVDGEDKRRNERKQPARQDRELCR